MAVCPSCGRDPGSNDLCPHCGADVKRRIQIRTLGYGAIGVAIIGLAVLLFFATRAPVIRVSIADLQTTSNYAYVHIDGVVSRNPNYNAAAQTITFWVRDDSGELLVSAYRSTTQDLIAADKFPAPGDTVSLQGTVRVRANVASLTLDSIESLTLIRVTDHAPLRDIGSITPNDALHAVTVRGVVRSIHAPFDGLTLITLRDATGAIDLALPTELEPILGPTPLITIGQSVQVIGTITLYENSPQITLRRGADLTSLAERVAFAKFTPLADLSEAWAGRWAHVEGVLEKIAPFSAGVKLTLSDGRQRATVLVWQDVWNEINAAADLEPGATLSVRGAVSMFQGQLEIEPEIPQDVTLLHPAPIPPAASVKPIGSITDQDLNTVVTTRGTIEQVDPINRGVRYQLSDQDQSITLLIWHDVIPEQQQRDQFVTGAVVSVTGSIETFGGQLEIVPETSDQVIVVITPAATTAPEPMATPTVTAATATLEPTVTPKPTATKATVSVTQEPTSTPRAVASAPSVSIKAITADDVDKDVAVRGKVVETASFSVGFKFLIDDGTGRIWLTLFGDDYKFVANRAGLNLGADVSIVAEVAQYQGVLELQPHAGRDVTINTPGSNASVPLTTVNQLGKSGQIVAIEGRITEVKGFSAGQYLAVDDGTGNVRVTLFSNVLSFVPNKDGLVVGAQVRVVGKTDFRGRVQIVPALGYDVTLK